MHGILCEAGLVEHVIRRMSPAEATQLAVSCRIAAQGARTFKAAIAFACTRAYSSNDFDVTMWEQIWESCAQSVYAGGLEPFLWAHSRRFIHWSSGGFDHDDNYDEDELVDWTRDSSYKLDCFHFLSSLLKLAGNRDGVELVQRPLDMVNADMSTTIDETANASISAILMVDAYHEDESSPGRLEDRGCALVALSNGRLAFMFWKVEEYRGSAVYVGAAVYTEKNLPTLFDLISSTSRHDCHWTLSDDHTLTVICNMALDRVYYGDWWEIPFPYWADTDLMANDDQGDRLENILRTSWHQRTQAIPQTRPEVTMEHVIQEVVHIDPPVLRDESLLALQADSQWAEDVERRIRTPDRAVVAASHDGVQPVRLSDKVYLLSFRSGKGELFRKMLLQDKEFKSLREHLRDAGYPVVLPPSGALVLVRPDQYLEAVNCPILRSRTLKRYNVLISESEEYLMNDVLLRMASKQRPRENRGERQDLDLYSLVVEFEIKRTFICEAPKLLVANSVVQSTTEAVRSSASSTSYFVHTRSRNPRRYVQGTWAE